MKYVASQSLSNCTHKWFAVSV